MSKVLIISYLGAFFVAMLFGEARGQVQDAEKNIGYSLEKGFSPAQRSLTTAFLKMADSLRATGDPEIYIRWVLKENERIDKKYAQVFGDDSTSRPAYLDNAYVANLLGEWRKLEKPLKLDELCRESGKNLRLAIMGSWNKTPEDWAAEEEELAPIQKRRYVQVLENKFLEEGRTKGLEEFYVDGGGYDSLSDSGKKEMSNRYWLGKMTPEQRKAELARYDGGTVIVEVFNEYQELLLADMKKTGKRTTSFETLQAMLEERLQLHEQVNDLSKLAWNEKDAIWHSHMVRGMFLGRFEAIDKKLSHEGAKRVQKNLVLMVENLLVLAHLEFMAGLAEKMADEELAGR